MQPAFLQLLILVLAVVAMSRQAASAIDAHSLLGRFASRHWIHDPGSTDPVLASRDGGVTPYYIDMKGVYKALLTVAPTIVAGTGITRIRVKASSDVAGAVNATEVLDSGAVQLDNIDGSGNGGGDIWRGEVHGQQIRQLDPTGALGLRYLTILITTSDATDEAVVTALLEGMFQFEDQSATVQN